MDVYHHHHQFVQKGSQCITIWGIFKLYIHLLKNSEQASLVVQVFHVAPAVPQGLVLLVVQEVHVPLGVQFALEYLPVL